MTIEVKELEWETYTSKFTGDNHYVSQPKEGITIVLTTEHEEDERFGVLIRGLKAKPEIYLPLYTPNVDLAKLRAARYYNSLAS